MSFVALEIIVRKLSKPGTICLRKLKWVNTIGKLRSNAPEAVKNAYMNPVHPEKVLAIKLG